MGTDAQHLEKADNIPMSGEKQALLLLMLTHIHEIEACKFKFSEMFAELVS